MVLQAVQIAFAIAVVSAFGALQLKLVRPDDLRYLLVNLIAAAGLAVTAVISFQIGFVITNVAWALVSAASLIALVRARRRS